MPRPRNRNDKKVLKLCDWCTIDRTQFPDVPELNIHADFRLSVTDMDGILLSSICLCAECAKRGATFDGHDFDAKN